MESEKNSPLTSKEDKLVYCKLITGDEFLAKVVENKSKTLVLRDPCALILTDGMMAFQKLNPFVKDETLVLQKKHVIIVATAHDEVQRFYHNSEHISKSTEETILSSLKVTNDKLEKKESMKEFKPIILKQPSEEAFVINKGPVKGKVN